MSKRKRTVAAYTWPSDPSGQEPDPTPGYYYVTAIDPDDPAQAARRKLPWFMLGPFGSHRRALDHVEPARQLAEAFDSRTVWMSFGTVRVIQPSDWPPEAVSGVRSDGFPLGQLNDLFPEIDFESTPIDGSPQA